jgi:amino acid transporter
MFGFILNIVFAYCAYDIDAIMTSPLRQPLGALVSALGNHTLARFLWLCTVLSNFGVLFVMTVSSSRVYFAYARDGALPFSKWLSHVNDTTKTPVNSTFTLCMIIALLGSISVGNSTALNGLFSGSALAGAVAYLMPVLMR